MVTHPVPSIKKALPRSLPNANPFSRHYLTDMVSHALQPDANLFAALRQGFPDDLEAVAVETDSGLQYAWRDLDEASAMVANMLASLEFPPSAGCSAGG